MSHQGQCPTRPCPTRSCCIASLLKRFYTLGLILVATGYDEDDYDYNSFDYDNYVYHSAASNDCEVIDIQDPERNCSNIPSYPISIWTGSGGIVSGIPMICGGELYDEGFEGRKMSDVCYAFNVKTNSWTLVANLAGQRSDFASAPIKDALWITGGKVRTSVNETIQSEDASTEFVHVNGSVSPGPNLPYARDHHCMVTLHNNHIMILGSDNSTTDAKNVVIYDPEVGQFMSAPSMLYDRNGAGCALFYSPLHGNRPVVLAAGGFNVSTVEIFDYTNAKTWEESE